MYALKDGTGYAVKDKDGAYHAAVKNADGKVTWDSSDTSVTATDVDQTTKVTEFKEVDKKVAANTSGLAANQTFKSYKKDNGELGYVVENADGTFNRANVDSKTGVVSVGTKISTSPDVLATIDNALKIVDSQRSSLGAIQNRFDSAITNLGNTVNNLSSARSRIEDSDYATEVSNMSRAQILQQAGTSVLAQANQTTQNVLSLLR